MELNQQLLRQFEQEASNTRKMLEQVPQEHFDFKPHAKSMSLKALAAHIAELPGMFISQVILSDELDFNQQKYVPFAGITHQALMAYFEENYQKAVEALTQADPEELKKTWTMRKGEHVIFSMPRMVVIRSLSLHHFIHHRGQLSVYLRLLDVPVPGMYGPSADERIGG
ncbi:DinB family protein [Rufibacter sediminis]|uniref:DUF1572 family protein n=1 Tax=Rufibacter sediminis TaxID=2762756 RepID=A0ABR6VUZ2_9BACT|nr:DinB family protein [Rufibacter sediminis]MBC3541023.1 DUF1572 family protein [Rufibacter sediminis]